MRAGTLVLALHLALMAFTPAAVMVVDRTVHWLTIRGVIVPGSVVGTGTGAVAADGFPWATTGGLAFVNPGSGTIKFEVSGLALAAGNSIGTTGGLSSVRGTLVCETDGSLTGNSVLVDTPLVALNAQGKAMFHGNAGAFPPECSEPDLALLIRTAGGTWVAYGAVRRP